MRNHISISSGFLGLLLLRSHAIVALEHNRLNAGYVFRIMPCSLTKSSDTAISENSFVGDRFIFSSAKIIGNPLISIVDKENSTLEKHTDIVLNVVVEHKNCFYNLALTTSSLATMTMGDAKAVALIKAHNLKLMDVAKSHPAGSLVRWLFTCVRDIVRKDNLPFVSPRTTVRECLFKMTASHFGLVLVFEAGQLEGIITDGDLRRAMI